MAVLTASFLAGSEQLPRTMVESWQALTPAVITPSTGVLQQQLQSVQDRLTALLAAVPNPAIATGDIVVPITIVLDYKNALDTFEYQFSGLPLNLYANTRTELDSVYDQYSIAFQTTANRTKPFIY